VKLVRYTGHSPSNVARDAKYTVTLAGDVRLVYRLDSRTKELLTTAAHPKLVERVNDVKTAMRSQPGGQFYINEYGDLLVPDGTGGNCYYAGHYEQTLEFEYDGVIISPQAPAGLKPGEEWKGPHAGISYVLAAGGQDVKYTAKDGRRRTEHRLSDALGMPAARATAARITAIKGSSGGRFYINERCELFAPVAQNDYEHFVYIGHLEDSPWFDPPDGYERP
jgi:hypothetical protein